MCAGRSHQSSHAPGVISSPVIAVSCSIRAVILSILTRRRELRPGMKRRRFSPKSFRAPSFRLPGVPTDRSSSVGWLLAKGWDTTSLNQPVHQERSRRTCFLEFLANGWESKTLPFEIVILSEQREQKDLRLPFVSERTSIGCPILVTFLFLSPGWGSMHQVLKRQYGCPRSRF